MRFLDIFLSESRKSELLATQQGPKLLSALKKDRLADQSMTADQLTLELESMDPLKGKSLQWLVNRYAEGNFKLEDAPRVSTSLSDFAKKKNQLAKKDLNQYRSLSELEDAVEDAVEVKSKKQQKAEIKTEGADVVYKSSTYSIVKLKTEEAACYYGKGTKWCTASDNNNMFNRYNDEGPIYVILDHVNNRKFQVQVTTAQFMDEKDEPVDYQRLRKQYPAMQKIAVHDANDWIKGVDIEDHEQLADTIIRLANDVFGGRWPEAEDVISEDGVLAYNYAIYILKQPWPAAEAAIAADAGAAYRYAKGVLKQPWPAGEAAIATKPISAYNYASDVIKGPWSAGEAAIATDPYSAYNYAKRVLKKQWPAGEAAIATIAGFAYQYARDVIKKPWPAGEAAIASEPYYARQYQERFGIQL